jgi:dihydroflavonol-4-reductase
MKVLVTGATGFIGGNLTRALIKKGYTVRALVRKESDRRNINGLDIEIAPGDLTDRSSLSAALEGCDALFHVAAAYTFWSSDPRRIYETNVTGTENILAAACRAGIKKVVYTSSECTLKNTGDGTPGDESELNNPEELSGDYKRTKCLAEGRALEICREGLPLVVVNPTTPIGPYDVKPTPTGRIIVDFINGKMPAYVNTGMNVVDVEDVAAGHILAMEKGRVGERYVLGNRNLTLHEIFLILERLTGIKAPRLSIPLWSALAAAHIDEFVSGGILRKPPRIPVAAVKAARKFRYFDCTRAVRELGMPQAPVEEAFKKAIRWFSENNYIRPFPKENKSGQGVSLVNS